MVRPIAIVDNLSKTPAAEKITQVEKSQPEIAQRETAIDAERKNVEHKRRPPATNRADEVIIHREKQDRENKRQGKEEKQKEEIETKNSKKENPDDTPVEAAAEKTKPVIKKHLDLRV